MTRIDAAREAAGKTREQLAPYAVSARDAAAHYTDEAWQRLAPRLESAVEQARAAATAAQNAAQSTVDSRVTPRVVPLWEQARANVPPSVEDAVGRAAKSARKSAKSTRKVAKAARKSAGSAAGQALETARPAVAQVFDGAVQATSAAAQAAAHAAHDRGAAALPVLRGQVTLAEIEALAARNTRSRRSRWTRRFLVVGTLGVLAGGGVAAWKWWQQQSNPDWLVEESASAPLPLRVTPTTAAPSTAPADASAEPLSALPLDPEVEAKEDLEAMSEDGVGIDAVEIDPEQNSPKEPKGRRNGKGPESSS